MFMMHGVLLSGFVLCCCACARVGFYVCGLWLIHCVVSSDVFLSV